MKKTAFHSMGRAYGKAIYRFRRWIVVIWVLVIISSVPFAVKAPSVLLGGGYFNFPSESHTVEKMLHTLFGDPLSSATVVFDDPSLRVTDRRYIQEVNHFVQSVKGVRYVASVSRPQIGKSGHTLSLDVGFKYSADAMQNRMLTFRRFLPKVSADNPAQAYIVGTPVVYDSITRLTLQDAERADAIAVPITGIVLLFIFGTLISAAMPLLVGISVLMAALAVIDVVGAAHPISMFVLSIASILGLGLSIDYSLLMIKRYREELQQNPVQHAVIATVSSAGESIFFSGLTVAIGFLGLLFLGVPVTNSLAFGGFTVVSLAVLSSLTLMPAVLAMLGPKINSLCVANLFVNKRNQTPLVSGKSREDRWSSWAKLVMSRPWSMLLISVAILATAGWPALSLKVGVPDASVLSQKSTENMALTILKRDFPQTIENPIYVVIQTINGSSVLQERNIREINRLTSWVASLSGVTKVLGLTQLPPGLTVPNKQVLSQLYTTGNFREIPKLHEWVASISRGNVSLLVVQTSDALDSRAGKALVRTLRSQAAAHEAGLQVRVGGMQAQSLDLDGALYGHLPLTAMFVIGVTLVLLILFLRSLVLAIKAVLMNVVSVAAAFGGLALVFQQGWLGFARVGFIDVLVPVILFCVLFGLSMDYEIFLLTRVREDWLHHHDNDSAVTHGIGKTGGIITSAALLFVIVTASFMTGSLETTQEFGFGITFSIILDATIVRLILVPATMRLLGNTNWWPYRRT